MCATTILMDKPVQAYVVANIDAPFGKGRKASVQLGRYVLNLGSRRPIACDDFRNTTNGYSAVRADLALRLANRADAFSTTGIRDVAGRSGQFAGHQIDGRLRYWLIPKLQRRDVNATWLFKRAVF